MKTVLKNVLPALGMSIFLLSAISVVRAALTIGNFSLRSLFTRFVELFQSGGGQFALLFFCCLAVFSLLSYRYLPKADTKEPNLIDTLKMTVSALLGLFVLAYGAGYLFGLIDKSF